MIKKSLIILLIIAPITFKVSFASATDEKTKTEILNWIKQLPTNPENAGFHLGYRIEAVPYILEALKSENPKVKYGCYEALYLIIWRNFRKGKEERPLKELSLDSFPENLKKDLKEAIQIASKDAIENPDPAVRSNAIEFLSLFGTMEIKSVLRKCFEDPDLSVRATAFYRLSAFGENYNIFKVLIGKEPETPEEYVQYLGDKELRVPAIMKLKEFGKEAIPALMKVASKDKEPDREQAIMLLLNMQVKEAIPLLGKYLREETSSETIREIQLSAVHVLGNIETPEAIEIVEKYGLTHKDVWIRMESARVLIEKRKDVALPVLIQLLNEQNPEIKLQVARILIENKEKSGIPALIELLKDKYYHSRAKIFLEDITKQEFGNIPPVVTKKMLDQYIQKWQDWWEKNKDTFEFQEKK